MKALRPLLAGHCYQCHSGAAKMRKGGLASTPATASPRAATPARPSSPGPDKSLLVRAVRHTDENLKMPPKDRLSDAQVADLVA